MQVKTDTPMWELDQIIGVGDWRTDQYGIYVTRFGETVNWNSYLVVEADGLRAYKALEFEKKYEVVA